MEDWEKLIEAANQTTLVMAQRQARLLEHRMQCQKDNWDADDQRCHRCSHYRDCLEAYETAFRHL